MLIMSYDVCGFRYNYCCLFFSSFELLCILSLLLNVLCFFCMCIVKSNKNLEDRERTKTLYVLPEGHILAALI